MKIEFTINTTAYESNSKGTYFYATDKSDASLWIKRRISKAEFEAAHDQFVKEEAERKLDAAAENDEITAEQFCGMVAETEESNATEAGKKIELDMAMEELGYYPIDSEWNDIRYSTCDGQSKVMAWDTVEEGMEWVKKQELETEARMLEEHVGKKAPKAKKERKPRKSKDIAYEGHGVTLTAKQVDFIKHLPDTCFWEHGLDSCIWCDVLADEIGGQFAGKPMTTGAMLSTICEKGLGGRAKDRINGRKCTSFALTELGKLVAAELGLH